MTTLVADIEGNGLYRGCTKIHCIVTKDIDTGEVKQYFEDPHIKGSDGTITEGVAALSAATCIIGHNWIGFDSFVIKKFYQAYQIKPDKIVDTMLLSYMFDPHRLNHIDCPTSYKTPDGSKRIGPHSLKNWGYVVGRGKVEHEDWEVFSPNMLRRCVEDVEITHLVYKKLLKTKGKWDWGPAIELENHYRMIMSEAEYKGWPFDEDGAKKLIERLSEEEEVLATQILQGVPLRVIGDPEPFKGVFKKDGTHSKRFLNWFEKSYPENFINVDSFEGEFCKVTFEPMNLNSNVQVKEYLLSVGWVPTEWTYQKVKGTKRLLKVDGEPVKSSPKLTEDSYDSIPDGVGQLIARRNIVTHRLSMVTGFLENTWYDEDGDCRISSCANTVGTNTARSTHSVVANVPKADPSAPYGSEIRALFGTEEDCVLAGFDLFSLEDRVSGHYTFPFDRGAYAKLLLEGDPHTRTVDSLGLVKILSRLEDSRKPRDVGKTINYAMKYGCFFPKLAEIIGCDSKVAKKLWGLWWKSQSGMNALNTKLLEAYKKRKQKGSDPAGVFIRGADGRKLYARSTHSLSNLLFQNAGSVIFKWCVVYIYEMCQEEQIPNYFVGAFHDEAQSVLDPFYEEEYKEVVARAVAKVNKRFNFHVPMDAEVKYGNNWKETH